MKAFLTNVMYHHREKNQIKFTHYDDTKKILSSESNLYTVYYCMYLYVVLCTKYTNNICLNQTLIFGPSSNIKIRVFLNVKIQYSAQV